MGLKGSFPAEKSPFQRNMNQLQESRSRLTDKKEKKIFLIYSIRKLRWERLQSHIWGRTSYEEMRKYWTIYEKADSHIWLCNRSLLDFLIYEENFFLLFYKCRLKDIIYANLWWCTAWWAWQSRWPGRSGSWRCAAASGSRTSCPGTAYRPLSPSAALRSPTKPNNLSDIILRFFCCTHLPNIRFRCSQKWNYATSFPIPTFMCLWAIYSQDRSAFFGFSKKGRNLSQIHERGNWETEHYNSVLEITRLHNFISGNS